MNYIPSDESINSCVTYLRSLINNSIGISPEDNNQYPIIQKTVAEKSASENAFPFLLPQFQEGYVPFEMGLEDPAANEEVVTSSWPTSVSTIWDVCTEDLSLYLNKSNDCSKYFEENPTMPNNKSPSKANGLEPEPLNDIVPNITTIIPNAVIKRTRIIPFYKLKDCPFRLFNIDHLHSCTEYTHNFKTTKRSAVYYGTNPYAYGNTYHKAKPFSDNPYLQKILSYVEIVIPGVDINSAIIHRYENGESHIPYHSDDEKEIEEGSKIITISLGESRFIEFQNIKSGSKICELLHHGDVFVMDKNTQSIFSHSIPADLKSNLGPRMSITLRKINTLKPPSEDISPPVPMQPSNVEVSDEDADLVQDDSNDPIIYSPLSSMASSPANTRVLTATSHAEIQSQHTLTTNTPNDTGYQQPNNAGSSWIHPSRQLPECPAGTTTKPKTLYVSSSMFRHLDTFRLSSDTQEAVKLFYPGADAYRMLNKLKSDKEFNELDKNSVTKIFILTGCNNVDSIYFGKHGSSIARATNDLSNILEYLIHNFPSAIINVISILPRKTKGRNDIIHLLNSELQQICRQSLNLEFIDLFQNNMFVHRDGKQRSNFFMPTRDHREDDVHLNAPGVVRLAKHLKFIAHNY